MPRNKKKTVVTQEQISPSQVEQLNSEQVTLKFDVPELQLEVDHYNQNIDYVEEHRETIEELKARLDYEEVGREKMRQLLGVSSSDTTEEIEGDTIMTEETTTGIDTIEETLTVDDTSKFQQLYTAAKFQQLYTAATGEGDKDAGFSEEEIEVAEQKAMHNAANLLGVTVESLKKAAIVAKRDEKIASEKKPRKAETVFIYPTLDQLDTDGCMMVPLSSLVALDEVGIPNASKAVRKIDKNHAFKITVAYENKENVEPPIVLFTNKGNALVSGNHRRYAFVEALRNTLATTNEQGVRIEASQESLLKLFNESAFRVRPITTPMTPFEVIELAYSDNRHNALPMSEGTMKEYAILLYDHCIETKAEMFHGKKFSLRAICSYAGLRDHSSVSRALKARADALKKTVDAVAASPEDAKLIGESAEAQDTKKEKDKFASAKKSLFSSIAHICSVSTNVDELTTELREYCTETSHSDIGVIGLVLRNLVANLKSPN